MTDAELQAEYQKAARREGGSRTNCPSPEQLQQLVERTGSEEERLDILDHVMSCPDCHRELALLQGLQSAKPREALVKPGQWLAAASLLIVFAGGVLVSRGVFGHPASEPMRGGGSGAESVSLVGAVGPVAQGQPGTLVWHSVPSAVRYTVEVLGSDDRVEFSAQTADTVIAVPALAPPAAWWVRATLPDGSDRRSGITRFGR